MMIFASSTSNLESLLEKASDAYYNNGNVYKLTSSDVASVPSIIRQQFKLKEGSKITDAIFDEMVDFLKRANPKAAFLRKVGAPVRLGKKQKVKLPIPMPSLDKRKPDTVDTWLQSRKGPYCVSLKLDGSSIELVYKKNQPVKVYSRGDGETGGDISFLAPSLNIPKTLPQDTVLRGEAIIPKTTFAKLYAKEYENARAMANGITNRTDAHPGLKHVDVIIYRQLLPVVPPFDGLRALKTKGFKTVPCAKMESLDAATLEELLQKYKKTFTHEIDGLVIVQNKPTKPPVSNEKPGDAIAFKSNAEDESAETTVVRVEWNVNRTGMIFPRVQIEPVRLDGATVTYATGKSAGYIFDAGIGPGARIEIARSGGVIPEIRRVLKKVKPSLPNIPFVWKGEHIFAEEPEQESSVLLGQIQHFFVTIGVEQFKAATIAKFIASGYDSVAKILKMPKQKFINIPGGSITLQKVYEQIQLAIQNVPLAELMDASGIFGHGIGTRKANAAINAVPNLLSMPVDEVRNILTSTSGFGALTAQKFTDKLPEFKAWLKTVPINPVVKTKKAPTKGPLLGQYVLFTGIRDASMESEIEKLGGQIATSISKATILVAKDKSSTSSKSEAAREKGIPILTPAQFRAKYLR